MRLLFFIGVLCVFRMDMEIIKVSKYVSYYLYDEKQGGL